MKVYWVSIQKWMTLTVEEHRRLDAYCREMGMELGIDFAGWHIDEQRGQADFQKDKDEYRDEQSLGGREYRGR